MKTFAIAALIASTSAQGLLDYCESSADCAEEKYGAGCC